MDSNDRVRFLAEEKERAWATERDADEAMQYVKEYRAARKEVRA